MTEAQIAGSLVLIGGLLLMSLFFSERWLFRFPGILFWLVILGIPVMGLLMLFGVGKK